MRVLCAVQLGLFYLGMKEQPLTNSCDHHVFQAGRERSDVTVFPDGVESVL